MKGMMKRSKKVEEILYSKFRGNEAMRCGTSMEETARQQYVTYQQQKSPTKRQKRVGCTFCMMWCSNLSILLL